MMPARKKSNPHQLIVGMTSARLGDRIVQVGCAHGGRLAAVASLVGLSGRAVAVVADNAAAARVRKGAEQAGVFIEIEVAPSTQLPLDAETFDVAIIDDTGGLLTTMTEADRNATIREAFRILRAGARLLVLAALPKSGLGALFSRGSIPSADPVPALQANGFALTRVLGEGEGLRFIEGVKRRAS